MNFADKTKKDRDRLEEMRREANDRAWEEAFMNATDGDDEEWKQSLAQDLTMELTTTGREIAEVSLQIMWSMENDARKHGIPESVIEIQVAICFRRI